MSKKQIYILKYINNQRDYHIRKLYFIWSFIRADTFTVRIFCMLDLCQSISIIFLCNNHWKKCDVFGFINIYLKHSKETFISSSYQFLFFVVVIYIMFLFVFLAFTNSFLIFKYRKFLGNILFIFPNAAEDRGLMVVFLL